ncbi:hypothetical protein CIFAM_20_00160 [Citrobacter farmeri GTC 1319]|nr:hypothetical protein CIFAM_20_00160 [Citrobacter farmeri GTC 1319]
MVNNTVGIMGLLLMLWSRNSVCNAIVKSLMIFMLFFLMVEIIAGMEALIMYCDKGFHSCFK